MGYSNTHLFLLFLFVNTVLLGYGAHLHYLLFSYRVQKIRLFQKSTIAQFGPALHSVRLRTRTQLWWSVIVDADMGGALFLICSLISILTFFFMVHHLWLLSTGTTTNESFKWSDIKEALETGEIAVLDQDDPLMYILLGLEITIGLIGYRG